MDKVQRGATFSPHQSPHVPPPRLQVSGVWLEKCLVTWMQGHVGVNPGVLQLLTLRRSEFPSPALCFDLQMKELNAAALKSAEIIEYNIETYP